MKSTLLASALWLAFRKSTRFISILWVALRVAGNASSATLTPSHDTSIYSGSGVDRSNGGGLSFMVGTNNVPETRRGLLRFDLSAIPRNARLQSVSLRLTLAKAPAGDRDRFVSLHRALASWGENPASMASSGSGAPAAPGDATWRARFLDQGPAWAIVGGDFTAAPSAAASVSTDLTDCTWSGAVMLADAQRWVIDPASNFGWFVLGEESTSRTNRQFFSRESTTPNTAPTLTLTYSVPEEQSGMYVLIVGAVVVLLLPLLRRRPRIRQIT